jgi:2-polyprenyl-3-methyl-5-hydroxy-6-metoxy-1,4-benzoquinol methylase
MDIETYAEQHPQLASEDVEPHLLELLPRVNPSSVLDVGCGNGRLISALISQGHLGDVSICGVDLSQTNIERLHARLPNIQVAVDNAEELKTVPDGSVELLISTQVLEHVDDVRMLHSVRRVLVPGGTAYISTVFKRQWGRFIWRTEKGEWALDPTHLREYTDDTQLTRLLGPAGLTLIESQKVPVRFPVLDFVLRRLPLNSDQLERIFASRLGRGARRLRVRIPGYFTWSLVLRA